MSIESKLNGKSICKPESNAEAAIDISNGKDYSVNTTYLWCDGVPHIINSHINPELKNEFNDN